MTEALSPVLGIQTAMHTRAATDVPLGGLVARNTVANALWTGVYDDVPENAAHPYVQTGEAIETPRNTVAELGSEVVVTWHVWAKARGFKSGLEIANRLRVLFDHQPLVVAGHTVISVRHEMTETLRDPDPEIRHLPVRFRITTEQGETA